jgi:hypothetical protein
MTLSRFSSSTAERLQARLQNYQSVNYQSGGPRINRARLLAACAVIFVVALGVRMSYWQDSQAEILQGYSSLNHLGRKYKNEVKRMYSEGGILFPREHDPGDAAMLVHPPGYSILMRAMYGSDAGGNALTGLRFLQVLCDAAAAMLVFLIAIELLPAAVSIIAGMLVALSPHFAYYSLWNSPDSLAAVPILLAVYLIVRAIRQPRLVAVIAAGACLGLSCWLRSNGLLIAPMLAAVIFLLIERGKRTGYAIALICATAATISPITIRNWVVFHEFIPTSITTGLNLIQGIAEYDRGGRFGMPAVDSEAKVKDVEWSGKQGYIHNVWKPDGIKRDRERFARGLTVIRSNPGWFARVMLRRAGFMLRYNDSRPHDFPFDSAVVPLLSAAPSFFHTDASIYNARPSWSASPAELLESGSAASTQARASLVDNDQAIEITDVSGGPKDLFFSAPFPIEKSSDYVLAFPADLAEGNVVVKVLSADKATVLGSSNLLAALKAEDMKGASAGGEKRTLIRLPFASGENDQASILLSGASESTRVQVGQAELFATGRTPFAWTSPFRRVVRAIQKPLYTTALMVPLILMGISILAFGRLWRVLLLLLVVPLYYLGSHSAFSVEYRYVLAMHYFLFVMSATAIYFTCAAIWLALRGVARRPSPQSLIESPQAISEDEKGLAKME